jgi:hypothetical protein
MRSRTGLLIMAAAAAWLAGCSLSDHVRRTSLDYNQVLEDVTNDMLVTNILLARDLAPLHFTDLSQIHGSLQMQAQLQPVLPFGQQYDSSSRVRNSLQAGISVNSAPSFDVVPLNTKDFSQGIASPVDFKFLYYFLDQGIEPYLLIRLLVDKLVVEEDFQDKMRECEIINHPNTTWRPDLKDKRTTEDVLACGETFRHVLGVKPADVTGWVPFQSVIPMLEGLDYTSSKSKHVFGPDVPIGSSDLLRSAGAASAAGLGLEKGTRAGTYHLVKTTDARTACLEGDAPGRPWIVVRLTSSTEPADRSPSESAAAELCAPDGKRPAAGHADTVQVFLYMRTVAAVFQYLGEMLTFEPSARTLPFYIRTASDPRTRFQVRYRGQDYFVDNSARCLKSPGSDPNFYVACPARISPAAPLAGKFPPDLDQTLAIIGFLNQLLNLYKNANEIPTTKAVETLP